MNVNDMLRTCVRRWYVMVLGLVLTAGLCVVAAEHLPPTYTRSATLVLLPGTKLMPEGGNPFLFMGGLTQARDVLVRSIDDDSVRKQVLADRPGDDYTVTGDPTTAGPLIVLTVTTKAPGDAGPVLADLEARVPQTLQRLQDEAAAPADARISSMELTASQDTKVDQKKRLQTILLLLVAGLVLTVLGTGLVDGVLRRRAGRHRAQRAQAQAWSDLEQEGAEHLLVAGIDSRAPSGRSAPREPDRTERQPVS